MNSLNIAFFGTPELCNSYLDALANAGMTPVVIITAPNKPVGRKQTITPPATKVWAQEHNIPVLQPEKLTPEFIESLKEFNLDLSIVIAYGKILKEDLINLPTHGTLNVHYSLLPRHRGASPTEAAILAGDTETGVTIQKMVFKLDAGDEVSSAKIPLEGDEYKPDLLQILTEIGTELLIDTIPEYLNGNIKLRHQDESLVTMCGKIAKEDGEVNLETDNHLIVWQKFRAYYGWPGIFYLKDGKRIKITEALYDDGTFTPTRVIVEGETETDYHPQIHA